MAEKTPRTRTISLSLCGTIIFNKADPKAGKTTKPSNKVRVKEAFSKLGINGKGNKASPGQKESGPSQLTSSSPENPFVDAPEKYPVEAVLHGVFKVPESVIGNDEHIGEVCFNELSKEKADTSVSRSQDPTRWGNRSGLSTLEKLSEISAKVDLLGNKIEGLEQENKTLKSTIKRQGIRIDQQDAQIRELKEMSVLWVHIRNRFFAVYLRDFHRDRFNSQDQGTILKEGNETAHYGEPVADALLFETGVRDDKDIYVELYGIWYEEVLEIREDTRTLNVLRDHATVKAEAGFASRNTRIFFAEFQNFIKAICDDALYVEYRYHDRGAAFEAWSAFEGINATVQDERTKFRQRKQAGMR